MATVQLQRHKRSHQKQKSEPVPKEFIEDCKILEPDFEKNRAKVQKIYNKWIEKGKKPRTIGKWLRPILRQWYSPHGVTALLPQEAHRVYVQDGSHSKKHTNIPAPQFTQNVNMPTSSMQESQKETEKIGSVRTEPVKTHERGSSGRFNQGADEYEIEEIDQYDTDYLRTIVKWLHQLRMDFIKEAFKWQTKFDEMQRENKALRSKLEANHIQ